MTTYRGALHWLGFKPQTTPGTPETSVTTFLPTSSLSMEPNQKPIARKAWLGTGVVLPSRKGTTAPNGSAPTEVLASVPQPWYWAMGDFETTQPAVGTDPTVYLHTIVDGGAPICLTAEGERVYTQTRQGDVYLDKVKLNATAGEIATLDLEWFGMSHEDEATLTSVPAFADDVLVVFAGTIKIDGATDTTVETCEVIWDNGLEQLPTIVDADGAPQVIRRKGAPKVTGKVKFVDFPAAEYQKLKDAEVFSFEVAVYGDTITHAYRKMLRVTIPACQWTGGMDAPITGEIITADAEFEGFWDTVSESQITVEAQNTISVINA